eukprot:Awhi_evm1s11345
MTKVSSLQEHHFTTIRRDNESDVFAKTEALTRMRSKSSLNTERMADILYSF